MNTTLRSLPLAALAVLALVRPALLGAQSQNTDCTVQNPAIVQDYLYGYAPVAMEATRALLTAVPDNTAPGLAPINQFAYGKGLSTPDDHLIVRPNADTLYTGAWLDLTKEPIILHVPNVGKRYYLIPMLDAYSNQFDSVGSRTTGNGEGNYAIVGPLWQGFLSDNVNAVIKAPTNTVWLLGRTLVNGPTDLESALAVTRQYQLIPLSAYRNFLRTGSYTPPTNVSVTAPSSDFKSFPVTNSPGFFKPEFFDVLAKYAARNPPPLDQLVGGTAFVVDGLLHQNQLDSCAISQAAALASDKLSHDGTQENGWSFNLNVGNYGTDYALRAAVAAFGFGANRPEDAIYMHTMNDSRGMSLTGSNSYVIHFAPGQTPPQHGFWSLTVYDSNGFLVPNAIDRYDVGSQTGLVPNPDGSLDILLQTGPPQALQSNWLPIPADSFTLTLRIYWPDLSVLSGSWFPPLIGINSPQ